MKGIGTEWFDLACNCVFFFFLNFALFALVEKNLC